MRQTKDSVLPLPFSQLAAPLSFSLWEGTIAPLLHPSSCALSIELPHGGKSLAVRSSGTPTISRSCRQPTTPAMGPAQVTLFGDIRRMGGVWRDKLTELREQEKWGRDATHPSAHQAAALMGTGDEELGKIRAQSIYPSPACLEYVISYSACHFTVVTFS